MSNMGSRFLFVADDPCLDFLNTQLIEKGAPADKLASFSDLVDWLQESGLEPVSRSQARSWEKKPVALRVLSEAKQFRKALREMVQDLIESKPVKDSTVREINHHMSLRKAFSVFTKKPDGFQKQSADRIDSPFDLLAPIAEAAANLLCNADSRLIRKCENERCILYFYDITKNHARRWCSMNACGNRAKAAAHYERVKRRRAGSRKTEL